MAVPSLSFADNSEILGIIPHEYNTTKASLPSQMQTPAAIGTFPASTCIYGAAPRELGSSTSAPETLASSSMRNCPRLASDNNPTDFSSLLPIHHYASEKPSIEEDGKYSTPALPSWTNLKTKAGKARKRLPLACLSCRRMKIRCSGEQPACQHCLRFRIFCVYKSNAKKSKCRSNYMISFEQRLRDMEERIVTMAPAARQCTLPSSTSGFDNPVGSGTNVARSPLFDSCKDQASHTSPPLLSDCTVNSKQSEIYGISTTLAADVSDRGTGDLLCEGSEALPPLDVQRHLAEVFFDQINGQIFYILHKSSYMRDLTYVVPCSCHRSEAC